MKGFTGATSIFKNICQMPQEEHRLTILAEALGIGVSQLEKEIAVKSTRLTKAVSRGSGISGDIVFKIVRRYPNISAQWLETGEGEMLVTTHPTEAPKKTVPLFDAHAAAGDAYVMDLAPVTKPSGYVNLGDMLSSDSQAAMYVFGSSMTPNYPSGCIIGLRQNLDGIIQPGSVYVVETDSNRYFKRLYYNDDKTAYTCISDNTMCYEQGARKGMLFYEPFDIPFDKVRRLFEVTGMIKRNQSSSIMSKS